MVRSRSSSCFNFLTCGGASIDQDDAPPLNKVKGSRGKLGWNFKKRSTRHQVLSNTVISESSSSAKKESPKATSIDFHIQSEPSAPQKISVSQWMDGMPPLTTSVYSKLDNASIVEECVGQNNPLISTETAEKISSPTTSESRSKISQNPKESSIIVIQASVRSYLAQKDFLKLKHVVKLQAAFRGHLERRKAAGTLRCVQAIIKMQALVRASQAHILKLSATEEKIVGNNEKAIQRQVTSEKEQSGSKVYTQYSSTEKLLSNGFARHLLESAPKKNPIHIHCDPLKPDSAWKWLERWVSVSSDTAEAQKARPRNLEGQEIGRASEVDEGVYNSMGLMQNVEEVASPGEYEENLITCDSENIKLQACYPSSSSTRDANVVQFDDADLRKTQSISLTNNSSQLKIKLNASKKIPISTSKIPEADSKQPRRSLKRVSYEQPETEGKKIVVGLRKARNPTFTAVQTKFEELSSSGISGKSNNSQVVGAESKFDNLSSIAETEIQRKEQNVAESLVHEPRILDGGSNLEIGHCISSTLNSPVKSEVGMVEYEQETKIMEKNTSELHSTVENGYVKDLDVEAKKISVTSESNTYFTISQKEFENFKVESVEAVLPVTSAPLEQLSDSSVPDSEIQMENRRDKKRHRSSPDVSPKSHMNVPEEVYITPSSQVYVKARPNKGDRSSSSQIRMSPSAGKKSPSNPNFDSVASNTEKRPKDSKSGKRRNSFDISRLDHVDLDPRDASINSLPSYMQATESARAKALANTSLRSITDVQDKHVYVKKRHSLPGTSGMQLSPRMQRSLSQAQQGAKGKGASDQDKKWHW